MRGTHPERSLEEAVETLVGAVAGETLLAAASGGPDSVALAALLARAAHKTGARLVLAHVNHGQRNSGWQDEAVVLALGASLRVRVVTGSLEPGASGEARLRAGRYALLAEAARKVGARRIFTAHHAEDQTETVLLALFRGTGPAGLRGMPERRRLGPGLELVRPLLGIRRERLGVYCALRHLPYALDPTNQDSRYRRNALRAALAGLRDDFPGLDEAVARCARIIREETAGSERAILRRSLRTQLGEQAGLLGDVPFERLEAVVRAVERGSSGRHFLKPGVELNIRPVPGRPPEAG